MIGQGSPALVRFFSRSATRMVKVSLGIVVLAMSSLWFAELACSAETQVRLRFAWGGGARRAWESTVTVDRGTVSELVSLGIEADEPGSMWIDDAGQLHIEQRSARTYDAFDVTVTAPDKDAKLTIVMRARNQDIPEVVQTLTLGDLLQSNQGGPLDQQGNRLLVKRAPGDLLRITKLPGESLIFEPRSQLLVNLAPQLQHLTAGTNVRIHADLVASGTERIVWSNDYDIRVPAASEASPEIAVETMLPVEEGAYDLHLTATERNLRQRLVPAALARPFAERKMQVVVVSAESKPTPLRTQNDWQLLSEIDPANPAWWQRSLALPQLKRIPGWPQGPLRHGVVEPWKHTLGTFTQLEVATDTPGGSWEAFPLPIDQPGLPHLLEIEYPTDTPQNLGISILEPNAAGAVLPIGVDSGIYGDASGSEDSKQLRKHRIVFWPRTRTPLVLLTQLDSSKPAGFGKMRILQGAERLPRLMPSAPWGTERLLAGYLDRPLFPENFSAPESLDASLGQTVDDWQTFYQAGTRLVDYLQFAGQNGLMVSVLADGSTIYPSKLLAPSPRYDTGLIGTQGRDPVRKDVLEFLFRLFDREQLSLVPTLHFDSPLPELEAALRNNQTGSVGITWVGSDGATWLDRNSPTRELAPYYNPLNETVQQAMLDVFRELVTRYANHPSFAGVGISISADGYAQLLGPEWGFDDNTIAQFERDMQTRVVVQPGEDPMLQRTRFLLGEGRAVWLQWRAQKLASLYRKMDQELQTLRPGAKLYLAPTGVLDTEMAEAQLRPALPQQAKVDEALLQVGFAPQLFENHAGIVFLRPQRNQPATNLGTSAIDLQLREAVSLHQRLGQYASSGMLFYHPPQRLRLDSFDKQSPYGPTNTYTLLVSQPLPTAEANRQRFIRSLAMADGIAMFDGGWLLPLGQEEYVGKLWNTFRQLPPEKFATSRFSRQPVVIRTHNGASGSYIYLANDSPWPLKMRLRLNAEVNCRVEMLGGAELSKELSRTADGAFWDVELVGYDLIAAKFSQSGLQVIGTELQVPPQIADQLEQEIQNLGARAAALEYQLPLELLENPGFELPVASTGVSGWKTAQADGTTLSVQRELPHTGVASLRWGSTRQVASLQSNLFSTPGSGRLAVAVWLKIDDANSQPQLRLAVEDANDGQAYYRFAQLGNGTVPLKTEWTQYIFPVEDIPLEGLPKIRVRLDLMGPGVVWLDDVQLFHLKFSQNERIELSKILVTANGALRNGELADCLHLLEGYWPQFLNRYVPDSKVATSRAARNQTHALPPVAKTAVTSDTVPSAKTPANAKPAEPGAIDRFKEYVPKFMRF